MRFIEWLKEREEARRKLFEEYLRRLSEEPVTVILFGSRARGDYNLLSDYDLLIIYRERRAPKPHELGLSLNAQCFLIHQSELRERAYDSSIVIAALLEGRILVDNLDLADDLKKLAEEIREKGAAISRDRVVYPVNDG